MSGFTTLSIQSSVWFRKFKNKAHVVLKTKELPKGNDCFQDKWNAVIGLYGQTLITPIYFRRSSYGESKLYRP
jgi:hypothetical protein